MPVPIPTLGSQKNPLSTVSIPDPALRDRAVPSRVYTIANGGLINLGNVEAGLESGLYILDFTASAEYGLFLVKAGTQEVVKVAGSSNVVAGAPVDASDVSLRNISGDIVVSAFASGTLPGTPAGQFQFYRVG